MKMWLNNEASSYDKKTRGHGKVTLPIWTLLVESDITVPPARLGLHGSEFLIHNILPRALNKIIISEF